MNVVIMTKAARNRFYDLFDRRPDLQFEMRAAIQTLYAELSQHPLEVGESRDARQRIVFVYPLVVSFDFSEVNNVVTISDVRLYGKAR